MAGQPSKYDPAIADQVCQWIAEGGSLIKYCEQPNTPPKSTILGWVLDHKEFSTKYARAREIQAELQVEEIQAIADDDSNDMIATQYGESGNAVAVSRAKLRIDTRMWYAKKLLPKKYGDKLEIENNVNTTKKMVMVVTNGDIDEDPPPTE
jgi:hypothetical protein